jgi:hypothetical protein
VKLHKLKREEGKRMGWIYTGRPKGMTHEKFFREYEGWKETNGRFLKWGSHLKEVYVAYEVRKPEQEPYVIALVIMTDWRKDDPFNFGYKDMDELMGPVIDNCPRSILELLTPIEKLRELGMSERALEWAANWRERCWEHVHAREQLKLKPGMIIRLEQPMRFTNGALYDTFEVVEPRRNIFQAMQYIQQFGTYYRTRVKIARRALVAAKPQEVGSLWPRLSAAS